VSTNVLTLVTTTDLKHSNILLALDDPDEVVERHIKETSPRIEKAVTESEDVPLSELLPTPTITDMTKVNIIIIDFGVCMLLLVSHTSDQS